MHSELSQRDPNVRAAAVRRFYALWRNRFHVWLKMEDGAQLTFKVWYCSSFDTLLKSFFVELLF